MFRVQSGRTNGKNIGGVSKNAADNNSSAVLIRDFIGRDDGVGIFDGPTGQSLSVCVTARGAVSPSKCAPEFFQGFTWLCVQPVQIVDVSIQGRWRPGFSFDERGKTFRASGQARKPNVCAISAARP